MTGFGSATVQSGRKTFTVEIKSVNSKFFDLTLRLPSSFKDKELDLRGELNRQIERGKVECNVNIESQDIQPRASINIDLLKTYHGELKKVQKALKLKESPDMLRMLLAMPDVLITEKAAVSEDDAKALQQALEKAIAAFDTFRKKEGKALSKDLEHRIREILGLMEKIEPFEKARIEQVRKKLRSNLEEALQSNEIDRSRFEQELIYYLEKFDVTEEKVRLASHCDFFLKTLKEEPSGGKKLSFISQEIGREINTIGSKSNDAEMQRIVVAMKDELEKIKEQVLNII